MNLKQLAHLLHLSQTTVSRALNGYPEVSERTRIRVQAAAAHYGYHPNTTAKRLATGRSMVIGHVIPDSSNHELVNPIFGDFVAGAARSYADHGYDMMLTTTEESSIEKTYRNLFQRGAVDGVVLQNPKSNEPRIELLHQLGVPFVVHGRSSEAHIAYDWVDINNKHSFIRATQFLIDLGHTRIGLINGVEEMDYAQRRRIGYQRALDKVGITYDPRLISNNEMTEVYGYRQTRHLLELNNPPTALLTSSMLIAIGACRALHDAGLRLGHDISIITHDDDLSYIKNGDDIPLFTATRSSIRLAGNLAAEMLIQRIHNPTAPEQTRLLETELVVGSSTAPAPSR